ncbi:MAG: hypothetical protein ACTHMC_01380 [Pseudobacter sp.]|uniref:hypothetical protein n=1 Tax=Pseudobacter sp. TaxID=2045420 RepID=UPI003F814CE8
MAKSISTAQAEALAEGFFDGLGSDEEFQPIETASTLIQLAGDLVGTAQENLNKVDRVSSGALSESIKILNPEVVKETIRVDIQALDYYRFVDQGVKGTRGGSGKYSFKNERVGKRMLTALRKWVIKENLKARTTRKYKAISKREAKRKRITETSNSIAYAIGKSIKRKGLKRTMFFTDAVISTQNKLKDLAAPFKIDILNTLPKKL